MDAQATYMYQNPNDQGSQRPGPDNGGNGNNSGAPRDNGSSLLFRIIIIAVLVIAGIGLLLNFAQTNSSNNSDVVEVPYSTFYQQVKIGNVNNVTFQGQDASGSFKTAVTVDGKTKTNFHFTTLPNGDPTLTQLLIQNHVTFQGKPSSDNNLFLGVLLNLLPWVLVFGVFILIARRATQSQQNIFSFGKSRAKMVLEDRPTTTFADVARSEERRNDLVEVVEFLKTPQKFQRLGGKIPRGVLLVGPPGTG